MCLPPACFLYNDIAEHRPFRMLAVFSGLGEFSQVVFCSWISLCLLDLNVLLYQFSKFPRQKHFASDSQELFLLSGVFSRCRRG
jgi:hypothetical protein